MLKKNLRFDNKQLFMCFDMESYNLNLVGNGNLPWQISWRIFDAKNLYDKQDHYVNWGKAPSKEIQELTNYSQKRMDEEGREPEEVIEELNELLYDDKIYIVGHNLLGFDIYLYNLYREKLGFKKDYSFIDRVIDTLCLAKASKFSIDVDQENFTLWQLKMTKVFGRNMRCKLSDLGKEFGIDFDEKKLHDASYDIWLNEEVFKKLMWKHEL